MPPPSGHGVWIASEPWIEVDVGGTKVNSPTLIAGCCLFPCDGPYIVTEFVSTNPALSLRLRHQVMLSVCQAVSYYGAMVGKTPLCFPKHKGVKKLMRKTGYLDVKPEVEVLFSPFFVPVGVFEQEDVQNGAAAEVVTLAAKLQVESHV